MPEPAALLTDEARSALGEVYRLLASIGAREVGNALVDSAPGQGGTVPKRAQGKERPAPK